MWDIIEPKSINDYKRCSCWPIAFNGCKDYLKGIVNEEDYEKISNVKKENDVHI